MPPSCCSGVENGKKADAESLLLKYRGYTLLFRQLTLRKYKCSLHQKYDLPFLIPKQA